MSSVLYDATQVEETRRSPLDLPPPGPAPRTVAQARALGQELWRTALERAQGPARDLDDRWLYWSRLAASRAIRAAGAPEDAEPLLQALERASRGYDEDFQDPDALHLLLSGFDPFRLDPDEGGPGAGGRSNPSGAALLALNGRILQVDGLRAELRGAIFPVRFADFDAGAVEAFFASRLARHPALTMTISQGRGQDFAVERWAGRRRSAGIPDNARRPCGGGPRDPREPPGLGAGPEFIETTLPSRVIWDSLGREGSAEEGALFELAAPGGVSTLRERPSPGALAVAGSGGGYLSNEIFYRVARLRLLRWPALPQGHLHTPYLRAPVEPEPDVEFEAARARIVEGVEAILLALIPALAAGR